MSRFVTSYIVYEERRIRLDQSLHLTRLFLSFARKVLNETVATQQWSWELEGHLRMSVVTGHNDDDETLCVNKILPFSIFANVSLQLLTSENDVYQDCLQEFTESYERHNMTYNGFCKNIM